MTSRFGLLAARIFPGRFWLRYSSTVVPVTRKYEVTNGSYFCSPVFSAFSQKSKYHTFSSSSASLVKDYPENCYLVDSSERHEHKGTEDIQVPVSLIEGLYNEVMTEPKWLTNDEWSAVGAKVYKEGTRLVLWPTLLLHYIAQKSEAIPGLYNVGMSLVDYVANLSDRHRLLRLVSAVAIYIHQGAEDDHEKALALYDKLCTEYDVFDCVSARILISALARTRYWHRCMELTEQMKIAADPGSKDYSPIIVAAMMNGDNDLANELLATLSRHDLMPEDEVFMHILANGTAEQVLTVLKDFAWIPSRTVIDSVITQLQRYTENCYCDLPC